MGMSDFDHIGHGPMLGGLGPSDVNGERMRGVPLGQWSAAGNEKIQKLFVEYQGGARAGAAQFTATIECEWYSELYARGFSVIYLACPRCMKGHHDIPVDAEGDPNARSLALRQEKKRFSVEERGGRWLLTVDEPLACTYCGEWMVKITNGVAYDVVG